MKKTLQGLFLAAGLAATSVAAAEIKIGFVNLGRISAEAPQAKTANDRLKREFEPREQEIAAMQKDLKQLEEKLNRDAAVMKEAERARAERDLRAREREVRRMYDELREDVNIRRNEELGKFQRRVSETVQELAKAENFDLILIDGVMYVSEKIDITSRVLDRLQQEARAGQKK
ncbi:MAG TPA: OmpH family outer membrane protein [Gammaproteobacteria bacterium]|nr:OmpH family outer membrane protein [Gammaproteobacteria bacterium]